MNKKRENRARAERPQQVLRASQDQARPHGDSPDALRARLEALSAELEAAREELRRVGEESERSRKALLSVLEDRKISEDALRESEARFRSLTELSSDWYWEQDKDFRQTRYVDSTTRISDVAARPELGTRRWDVPAFNLSDEDWAEHRALLERHEPFWDFEIERPNDQGGTTWISLSGEPVFDAAGNFAGYRGVGKNITDRKRIEAETARLAAIVEHSSDAIISRAPGGKIISWNAAAQRLFGYSAEEIIGQQINLLIPPEFVDEVLQKRERVSEGQLMAPFDSVRLAKDGRRVDVSITPSPVRDARGRLVAVSLIERDIGERKRAEAERARLAAIVEASDDAILSRDLSGILLTWNAAAERMFGYRAEEVVGRNVDYLIPPEERKAVEQRRMLVARGIAVPQIETVRIAKDGRRIEVAVTRSVIRDADGKPVAVSLMLRDIGERKRAERALMRQKDLYTALSRTNEAIVRGIDREELFQTLCRISIEQGRFLFAWVGLLDAAGERLAVAARYGDDSGYLDALHAAMADPTAPRRGLTWRALDTGAYAVANDFLTDPDTVPWHEAARARGVRAFAGFPLRQAGKVVGVLNVYSGTAGIFDDELLGVLDAMAADVSYALDNLEHDAQRRQAVEALAESEQRFRGLVEQSIAGICIIQDAKFAYVNPRFAEIRGYASPADLMGRDVAPWIAPVDRDRVAELLRQLIAGAVQRLEFTFTGLRRDGSTVEIGAHSVRATFEGHVAVLGMMRDISERKRAEEQSRRYLEQLESAFMNTVRVATNLSEMRDPYTAGHARRVGEIAAAIGGELGLDARAQDGLRVAGYLHDIGKMSIPTEILARPGRLNPLELELIREHSAAGYEILKDVPFPWPVAEVAWQHHERLDGSGYPRRLSGDAIIFEARVMAVADVIEAMASDRPYRPGLGVDAALKEIRRGSGSLYDAAAAEAALRLFEQKGYVMPK